MKRLIYLIKWLPFALVVLMVLHCLLLLCGIHSNFLAHNGVSPLLYVVIGLTTSADEFANTYDHEKGHLVRHISQNLGLEPYGEQEQYIAGYVSQQMFRVAKSFLCEHCRKDNTALANFIRVFL